MAAAPTADQIRELAGSLIAGALPVASGDLVDLIGALEDLKSAACGVQAEAGARFDASRRTEQAAQGVPAARQGRGVASEVALARNESPHRGQVLLGFAKVVRTEMPHTLARLKDGTLNEWRAMLLVRETSCLSAEHRVFVDEELCADPGSLDGLGTRRLVAKVRRLAYELDPKSVVRRASNAEKDRCVTVRPAPDTMTYLTGLLPVAQGVAVHAALGRDADALRAQGDQRSRAQLMADLLVSRITGVGLGDGSAPPAVPVTVNLTMSDQALLGGHQPADVSADGVVPEILPAEIARLLAARSLSEGLATWIRQLYVDHTGRLVAMTSKQRLFPDGLADFLSQRDLGICRTPYCDSPVRHSDHVQPADTGGETTADNGQGLCEACNYAKQAPGWWQTLVDDLRHAVETVTPTGHRYQSHAPPPVGWREPRYVRVADGRYQLVA